MTTIETYGLAITVILTIALITWRKLATEERQLREIHDAVAKAKASILADGVVSGPKGKYVPHIRWSVRSRQAIASVRCYRSAVSDNGGVHIR